MTIRVLLFGHYRDALPAGAGGSLTLQMHDKATPADVADNLAARDERFVDLPNRTRVAVREAFADWDTLLTDGDEVAFLPPMSGG